jgi:hypothetical protein
MHTVHSAGSRRLDFFTPDPVLEPVSKFFIFFSSKFITYFDVEDMHFIIICVIQIELNIHE